MTGRSDDETTTHEHTPFESFSWCDLCDLAFCAPDFDVVYRFTDAQAVAWLTARLQRYGVDDVTVADVEGALADWRDRPRGAEHAIGQVSL